MEIAEKQRREIEFWRDAEAESPRSESVYNLVNKMSDAQALLEAFGRHGDKLVACGRVLELGGGQGWAACLYKRLFPAVEMTGTDISPYAIASLAKWERVFDVHVEHRYACASYATQESDASIDLAFCFSSAHHFVAHRRTLRELRRILKPGGRAIYFREPITSRFMYRAAYRRVNRKRPDVPEDVLVPGKLQELAREAGLDCAVDPFPSLVKRGPLETVYFAVLARMPRLQRWVPCSANILFTKRA